jgi:hypothetical protein
MMRGCIRKLTFSQESDRIVKKSVDGLSSIEYRVDRTLLEKLSYDAALHHMMSGRVNPCGWWNPQIISLTFSSFRMYPISNRSGLFFDLSADKHKHKHKQKQKLFWKHWFLHQLHFREEKSEISEQSWISKKHCQWICCERVLNRIVWIQSKLAKLDKQFISWSRSVFVCQTFST